MPQTATIKSLPAGFRMMKAMQAEGVEWGEDYRLGARDAVAELLRGRMEQLIDEHLERMAELGRADRRNGCYRRGLLTELGDIELAVPRTAPSARSRWCAPMPGAPGTSRAPRNGSSSSASSCAARPDRRAPGDAVRRRRLGPARRLADGLSGGAGAALLGAQGPQRAEQGPQARPARAQDRPAPDHERRHPAVRLVRCPSLRRPLAGALPQGGRLLARRPRRPAHLHALLDPRGTQGGPHQERDRAPLSRSPQAHPPHGHLPGQDLDGTHPVRRLHPRPQPGPRDPLVHPNSTILAAIRSTCASLCVRGLRSCGRRRSIGQSSIRSASATRDPAALASVLNAKAVMPSWAAAWSTRNAPGFEG